MATNFNENSIVSSGGFKPSSKDTPLDIRTRVETERDIYEIPNPYIGMIVYVKDTGKRFEILTLKEVDTGLTTKNVVDTYKQFTVDLEEYAKIEDVPTKVSELENDKGYLVNQDISGKADVEDIPTKVSELENDKGYATERFVDSKIETINNTVNSNTNTINSKINTINSNINTINSEIDGIDSNIANLNTEVDNINTDLVGVSESIEGSWISVDSKDGYLKDIEIIGNTIQDQDNLADIRSVGDKVEGQELYEIPVLCTGKNLFNIADYDVIEANNTTFNYDVTNNTYTLTYSGTYTCIVFDLTKHLYIFEGKEIISSCKFLNSNSSAKNSIYLEGVDSNGKKIYFNSTNGYEIPKNTLSKLRLKILSNNTSVSLSGVCEIENIQLEEGTQVTPYQEYSEHKLTILSPTPLEKVGDVADRIVEKNGVWGVEKNIAKGIINGSENWSLRRTSDENTIMIDTGTTILFDDAKPMDNHTKIHISNKLASYTAIELWNADIEGIDIKSDGVIHIRLSKTKATDLASAREWLSNNNIELYYITAQPQFIPLPHDQQIKLRTFANKTNISFGCEIEPTLKAQVPKSIGASVSSHSEQIDNLTKELEKINNLEETVTSEVVSESDFITVTETSNGYFEDVKLEGRTLVNLNDIPHNWILNTSGTIVYLRGDSGGNLQKIQPNTIYTVIIYGLNDKFQNKFTITNVTNETIRLSNGVGLITSKDTISDEGTRNPHLYGANLETRDVENVKLVILEGDHTQNPPSYFEGLKSVGQDEGITITTTNAPTIFGKGGRK